MGYGPWGHKESDTTEHSTHSLLYGSILKSIHDYWKSYSFDYMNLCQQSDAPVF